MAKRYREYEVWAAFHTKLLGTTQAAAAREMGVSRQALFGSMKQRQMTEGMARWAGFELVEVEKVYARIRG